MLIVTPVNIAGQPGFTDGIYTYVQMGDGSLQGVSVDPDSGGLSMQGPTVAAGQWETAAQAGAAAIAAQQAAQAAAAQAAAQALAARIAYLTAHVWPMPSANATSLFNGIPFRLASDGNYQIFVNGAWQQAYYGYVYALPVAEGLPGFSPDQNGDWSNIMFITDDPTISSLAAHQTVSDLSFLDKLIIGAAAGFAAQPLLFAVTGALPVSSATPDFVGDIPVDTAIQPLSPTGVQLSDFSTLSQPATDLTTTQAQQIVDQSIPTEGSGFPGDPANIPGTGPAAPPIDYTSPASPFDLPSLSPSNLLKAGAAIAKALTSTATRGPQPIPLATRPVASGYSLVDSGGSGLGLLLAGIAVIAIARKGKRKGNSHAG